MRASLCITPPLAAKVLYEPLSAALPSIGCLVVTDYIFFGVFALAIARVALRVTTSLARKAKRPGVGRVAGLA